MAHGDLAGGAALFDVRVGLSFCPLDVVPPGLVCFSAFPPSFRIVALGPTELEDLETRDFEVSREDLRSKVGASFRSLDSLSSRLGSGRFSV